MSEKGTIAEKKAEIREQMASLICRQSTAERLLADCKIAVTLAGWHVLTHAPTVVAYSGLPDEPDLGKTIRALLEIGVDVALPRYSEKLGAYELSLVKDLDHDLFPGLYEVDEPRPGLPPIPPNQRDSADTVWLVPGMAFDRTGGRLGRGAGYYDRMLADASGILTGVTHQWRVVEKLPREKHDVRMNWLVTEEKITKCTCEA
ncbi:MAG: 5-formyltetrahydrofolate cyclo-ligase [Lentisphaeria bacterium]|nr:5-formyltetrahydrofolate cyclo-ligase [Lentisphaeria bacterium]